MSNQPPVLTGVEIDRTFAENTVNATPQLLAPTAVYSDDGDADGVVITVSGLLAEDRITIVSSGALAWDSGTGEITIGGVVVATSTGGLGADFVVTFNSSATNDAVEDVLQALGYGNASDAPTASRDLTITVTDDDGIPNIGLSHFTPTQQASGPFATFGAASMTKVAVGDYDGDGDDDLVVGGQNGLISVYVNSGGTWAAAAVNPFTTDVGFWANPTFGDIDNDGDQDLIVGNYDGQLNVFRNDGGGAYTELVGGANPLSAIDVGTVAAPALYDFDSDGDADLLIGTWDGGLSYYRNDAGAFSRQIGAADPFDGYTTGSQYPVPTLHDLDGDGDQDLIFTSGGPVVLRENVDGQFVAWTKADPFNGLGGSFVGGHVDVAFTDTDGDGDADAVWSTINGPIWPFRNDPDTGLTITVNVTAEHEPSVALDDDLSTYGSETTAATGNVFWNNYHGMDYNPAGDPITIVAINGQPFTFGEPIDLPGGGKLTMAADGWWSFDADGDFTTLPAGYPYVSTFTYTVNGGSTATVQFGIYGVDNNDVLVGTAGDENVWMGVGDDIFKGGDGNDIVWGEAGNDSLRGEAGADQLSGGNDNDTLIGGDGADYLSGGMGDDVLHGQGGADTFDGWAGNDTFYVDVFDIIREFEGNGTDTIVSAGNYWLQDGDEWWVENLTLSGTAAISGVGNGLNNVITGNSGANALSGNGGADTLKGGAGNDTLQGGAGADSLFGDAGDDSLNGDGDNDTLDGGAGNDILNGGAGYDILYGGAGNDTLYGQGESDTLYGGVGNDVYYIDSSTPQTIETAGQGIDTVYAGSGYILLAANIENLVMQGTTTHSRGNDLANQITGNTVADTIEGMGGDDQISTGLGDDYVWGGAGRDKLYGEAGADILDGEADNDELYGGEGDDTLAGADGVDKLWGGAGNDSATGGAGNDVLYGDDGGDILSGWTGNDTLYGGADNDYLQGEDGADKLYGENGADQLFGGAGADTIDGGVGDDHLSGGEGVDKLTGGAGADVFWYGGESVRLTTGGLTAQRDTVTDFNWAEGDRIDLRSIDAIVGGDDDAFTFVAKFTRTAGQAVLVYNATADTTSLRLDIDGDARADIEIVINGDQTGMPLLTGGEPATAGGWLL